MLLDDELLNPLKETNFKKIADYVVAICEIVIEDFASKGRRLCNDENEIRTIMLEEYFKPRKADFNMTGFSFYPEMVTGYDGDGKYKGRVDISIKLIADFSKEEAGYVIECKRLDGYSRLNTEYVNEGVLRFTTGKYSSYYGCDIMLGFVVKKIDIAQNADKIDAIQQKNSECHTKGKLRLVGSTDNTYSYECYYDVRSDQLELRHIFADYSKIVNYDEE